MSQEEDIIELNANEKFIFDEGTEYIVEVPRNATPADKAKIKSMLKNEKYILLSFPVKLHYFEKKNKYPIYKDFDQREVVGYVMLNKGAEFTMLDVLSPEVSIDYLNPKTGKNEGLKLLSFGLIKASKYLHKPTEKYGNLDDVANKNANK